MKLEQNTPRQPDLPLPTREWTAKMHVNVPDAKGEECSVWKHR